MFAASLNRGMTTERVGAHRGSSGSASMPRSVREQAHGEGTQDSHRGERHGDAHRRARSEDEGHDDRHKCQRSKDDRPRRPSGGHHPEHGQHADRMLAMFWMVSTGRATGAIILAALTLVAVIVSLVLAPRTPVGIAMAFSSMTVLGAFAMSLFAYTARHGRTPA